MRTNIPPTAPLQAIHEAVYQGWVWMIALLGVIAAALWIGLAQGLEAATLPEMAALHRQTQAWVTATCLAAVLAAVGGGLVTVYRASKLLDQARSDAV